MPFTDCIYIFFNFQVLQNQNQLRNADVELQQRAVEYLQLTQVMERLLFECPPLVQKKWGVFENDHLEKVGVFEKNHLKKGVFENFIQVSKEKGMVFEYF